MLREIFVQLNNPMTGSLTIATTRLPISLTSSLCLIVSKITSCKLIDSGCRCDAVVYIV